MSSGHLFTRAIALVQSVSSGWQVDMCVVTYSGCVSGVQQENGGRGEKRVWVEGTACAGAQRHELLGVQSGLGVR